MQVQYNVEHILKCIKDTENVLDDQYINDQIRTFYEKELAHYKSLMHLVVHSDISA